MIAVDVGEVRIRGVETGIFLAMNENGKLFGTENVDDDSTVFVEELISDRYLVYLSKKYAHMGWYVGIKRDGNPKNGKKTFYPWGQKAILFVPRKPFVEDQPLKILRNRHEFSLIIEDDGKVRGVPDEFHKNAVMEFTPSNPPGAFRIRGVESGLYLAMDSKGRLYGQKDALNEDALFTEHSQGEFFVYLSVRYAHLGWHVGIKRSGKAKKAVKTVYPSEQKAIQFTHKFPFPTLSIEERKSSIGALGENFPPLAFIDDEDK